ncbi:wings apart-like protein 2 [Argentina anserina]|uniref:wings apart-like protein 2 n=1 Tax=Argentina anserina TaxID=57926 RepID=UPI00217668C3|nr:wings apart-like protein 2 [Potentilla anserina]
MIVRTYGRRKGGGNLPRTYSDSTLNDAVRGDDGDDVSADPFRISLSQDTVPQFNFNFSSSSQDSSEPPYPPLKRPGPIRSGGVLKKKARRNEAAATATLMEAQEFGEMMEHVDEVNFALDGLRKGQPVRIRRASLLSLLGICATSQQRRLLRTQGMAKTIIEAILGLSFDDEPSDLAAAAIFYVLTCDGQDDPLLESPSSINCLIRFCKPIVSKITEDTAPKIGRKLLALRLGADISHCAPKRIDSSLTAILSKVHEILVTCKEMKPSSSDESEMNMPELCPKWIALLTMEKACLSTISLEETTGTVRQAGGNFKEKLRELGGLDAVFEVSMSCHSKMEGWLKGNAPSTWEMEIDMVRNLVLLLKCLKIMENATFLSKENQSHLLQMKGRLDPMDKPISFTELVISTISILSGLYLHRSVSVDKCHNLANGNEYASKKGSRKCQSNGLVSTSRVVYTISSSETTSTSMTDTYSLKTRLSSSRNGSSSGTATLLSGGTRTLNYGSRKDSGFGRRSYNSKNTKNYLLEESRDPFAFNYGSGDDFGLSQRSYMSKNSKNKLLEESQDPFAFSDCPSEDAGLSQRSYISEDSKVDLSQDSQDPFAFDEVDIEPSQWDILSGKKKISQVRQNGEAFRELDDDCQLHLIMSQAESSIGEDHDMPETSNAGAVSKEGSSLLADCLLTAVKVLMNLANENPVGCQQIAADGGLETMSSLIASHFPSFSSPFSERNDNTSSIEMDNQNGRHLTDQELDFLVAILGLLVNLVEKDGQNRSRLAAVSVHLPISDGFEQENHKDLILLICSIFLANQGAGECSEEGRVLPDDEAVVLQGEQEAEKMIVEAYAALLLAFLSTESKGVRDAIADCLPDRNLAILVPVLDRFVAFHLTLNMISPETHKVVSEVIESCRLR